MPPEKMIPLEDCKHRYTYRIHSRNLTVGVFDKERKGFVGIREKFGTHYLFTEFHRETGAPYGTVSPKEEIEKCPLLDIREDLGTFCADCDKHVEFHKENPDGTGDWYHLEKTSCPKAKPQGKQNNDLFEYLKPVTQKVELQNYIGDINEYANNESFFQSHIRQGVNMKLYTEKDLRRQFGASFSTVRRWVSGEAKPAPAMRTAIYEWIKMRVEAKLHE